MSNVHDDTFGLHSDTPATYELLHEMTKISHVEITSEGSTLAASLLTVPEAFNEGTAAILLDTVPVLERSIGAGKDGLLDMFKELTEKDAEEKLLPSADTTGFDEVLDFAQDDLEAARIMFQATVNDPEARAPLQEIEALRLLSQELGRNTGDVTVDQLRLLLHQPTAHVAAHAFPRAEELLRDLTAEDELTPAEARRKDRRDRAERNRIQGSGNRQLHGVTDLDIMIALDDDPVAIASLALNSRQVKPYQLIDILENADNQQIADWMYGMEVQAPQPGQITKLAGRFTEDRIRDLAITVQEKVKDGYGEATNMTWIGEIITNICIPRLILDPATATMVHHELKQVCEDDPATWAAVLLGDTDEEPARLSDLV